jgi:uncharacterized protein YndB with AHSA1/START domain
MSGKLTMEIPEAESVITMARVYEAPRDLVWEAITEPKHVARWWGGPGFTNPVCEMDVRPGGLWHHVMRFPDGRELNMNFVFVEVSKPRKLVWETGAADRGGTATCIDSDATASSQKDHRSQVTPQGHGPGDVLFTVTLDALAADQTAWKMVARFRSPKDREIALAMGFTKPIEASNERLVAHLKTLAASASNHE